MAKTLWVGFAMCGGVVACLGGTTAQAPVTPAARLQQARASADRAEWPAARESTVAFWVGSCKRSVSSVDDCASAQLIRGEAELATEAPETALLSFNWVLQNSNVAAQQEKANAGRARARDALQKLIDQSPGMTWLVVQQDFDDNYKFGPERAAYTLDGQPLAESTSRRQFDLREHRVVAQAIPSGHHRLGVEIHWKGQGTFDNYLWSSFRPFEFDAPESGALVVALDVTYKDGGPSDNSVEQTFQIAKLP